MAIPFVEFSLLMSQVAEASRETGSLQPYIDVYREVEHFASRGQLNLIAQHINQYRPPESDHLELGIPPPADWGNARFVDALYQIEIGGVTELRTSRVPVFPGDTWEDIQERHRMQIDALDQHYQDVDDLVSSPIVVSLWRVVE